MAFNCLFNVLNALKGVFEGIPTHFQRKERIYNNQAFHSQTKNILSIRQITLTYHLTNTPQLHLSQRQDVRATSAHIPLNFHFLILFCILIQSIFLS